VARFLLRHGIMDLRSGPGFGRRIRMVGDQDGP